MVVRIVVAGISLLIQFGLVGGIEGIGLTKSIQSYNPIPASVLMKLTNILDGDINDPLALEVDDSRGL